MSPQGPVSVPASAPDQVINFEGSEHHFPADFSDQDISKALASMHPQVSPAAQAAREPGFLESAGNVLKGAVSGVYNDLRPHSRAEKNAAVQNAINTGVQAIQGSPGAKDSLISAVPGGSTYLKAREGNYAGAAGDVAGIAALGGAAKLAGGAIEGASGLSGAGLKGAAKGAIQAASEVPLAGHAIKIPKAAYEGYQNAANPPRSFGPGVAPNPASPPASIASRMGSAIRDAVGPKAPNPGPGVKAIPNVPQEAPAFGPGRAPSPVGVPPTAPPAPTGPPPSFGPGVRPNPAPAPPRGPMVTPEIPAFGPGRAPNPARMPPPGPPMAQAPPEAAQGAPPGPASSLPPIDRTEMNRMVHARAHEMDLPGSPAGKTGHPQLSEIAKSVYGAKSWGDLSVDQMREVYNSLGGGK